MWDYKTGDFSYIYIYAHNYSYTTTETVAGQIRSPRIVLHAQRREGYPPHTRLWSSSSTRRLLSHAAVRAANPPLPAKSAGVAPLENLPEHQSVRSRGMAPLSSAAASARARASSRHLGEVQVQRLKSRTARERAVLVALRERGV